MKQILLLLIVLASSTPAWCADAAGRVILAIGDVTALRAGTTIALAKDASIMSGDEIRTGSASAAQIRFADSSIVALRAQSTFKVDDFVFKNGADGSENAVYKLLRGGLRTITGLIGRLHKRNYRLVTPTSTIGIRGTSFDLVVCAHDCRNADGSIAAAGTYGGVTHGSISLTPNANPNASKVFAKGDFFFAASTTAPPQPLLAPPAFLADKLEARQRKAAPSTTQSASAAAGKTSSGSTTTSQASSTLPEVPAATTDMATTDTSALTTPIALPYVATEDLGSSGGSPLINTATGFIATYYDGTTYISIDSCGANAGGCPTDSASEFTTSGNWLTSYANAASPPKGMLGSGTVVDSGSIQLNGATFSWGRWTGGFLVTDVSGNTVSNLPGGVLFGMTDDPTVNGGSQIWPTNGSVTYSLAGGPSPIDTAGNIGTMSSMTGTLDFSTRDVSFSANLSIAIPAQGTANLTLSGNGTITGNSDNLLNAPVTSSCAGTGCAASSSSGLFDARFAGSAAQVMVVNGIAQNAVKTSGGAGAGSVLFLNILKCTSGC